MMNLNGEWILRLTIPFPEPKKRFYLRDKRQAKSSCLSAGKQLSGLWNTTL
jgi:hypothetical protein